MENVNFRSNNNPSNNEGKREKAVLRIKEYEPMPGNPVEGGYCTLVDLMMEVSKLFTGIFKDYQGCYIKPYPQGIGFSIELYFAPPTDPIAINSDLPTAFNPITLNPQTKNNSPILTAYENMHIRANKKLYCITDDGKDLLSEFFSRNLRKNFKDGSFGEPDWSRWAAETPANNSPNAPILAVVTGVDLNIILSNIHGPKDDDGQYYQYNVLPIKPIASNTMMAMPGGSNPMIATPTESNVDWLITVQRLSMKKLNKLGRMVGLINSSGIPMVGRVQ